MCVGLLNLQLISGQDTHVVTGEFLLKWSFNPWQWCKGQSNALNKINPVQRVHTCHHCLKGTTDATLFKGPGSFGLFGVTMFCCSYKDREGYSSSASLSGAFEFHFQQKVSVARIHVRHAWWRMLMFGSVCPPGFGGRYVKKINHDDLSSLGVLKFTFLWRYL